YDPLQGVFLEPDGADLAARLRPEGFLAFRENPVVFADPNGAGPIARNVRFVGDYEGGSDLGLQWDGSCNAMERLISTAEPGHAWKRIHECSKGMCSHEWLRRNLAHN